MRFIPRMVGRQILTGKAVESGLLISLSAKKVHPIGSDG